MDKAFASWIGHLVILQLALGDIKVPLPGKLLKGGRETVRMRIGGAWDVDIYKAMILAVAKDDAPWGLSLAKTLGGSASPTQKQRLQSRFHEVIDQRGIQDALRACLPTSPEQLMKDFCCETSIWRRKSGS